MRYETILFDLDGTLLPMDQDKFAKLYLTALARKMAPHGYEPEELIRTIWAGTAAMVKNDGSQTNETRFWNTFAEVYGDRRAADEPIFDAFYRAEFEAAREACGFTENAKIVRELKGMGKRVILATNPIFPAAATEARIRWAGLEKTDFDYISTYENSTSCKPNPMYYCEICEKTGINPNTALMIGNDADEDTAAQQTGMDVFLLTDCLLNKNAKNVADYPNGSWKELRAFLGI